MGCAILAKVVVIPSGNAHGAYDTEDGCGIGILDILRGRFEQRSYVISYFVDSVSRYDHLIIFPEPALELKGVFVPEGDILKAGYEIQLGVRATGPTLAK